jgi:myotubularin-related protein 1/2
MLCMDPFYRTLSGFCILIEKEWVNAGHMFVTRLGHASSNYTDENRAPIFLQWIDCVWQLLRQYPLSFEFNEVFLMRIIDEASNCRFGTFIADNDHSRKLFDVEGSTASLWSYFHRKENFYSYLNPLYSPPSTNITTLPTAASRSEEVIHPRASMKAITFWLAFYLRSRNYRDKAYEAILERVFEMQCKIEELQIRLADAEKKQMQQQQQQQQQQLQAHAEYSLKRAPSVKPGVGDDNGGDDDGSVLQEDPDADAADQLMARAASSVGF